MRRDRSNSIKVFVASLAGAFALLCSAAASAGTPTLGPDCGVGAALVGTSSDSAGKVTIGTPSDPSAPQLVTCTLTFGVPYTEFARLLRE